MDAGSERAALARRAVAVARTLPFARQAGPQLAEASAAVRILQAGSGAGKAAPERATRFGAAALVARALASALAAVAEHAALTARTVRVLAAVSGTGDAAAEGAARFGVAVLVRAALAGAGRAAPHHAACRRAALGISPAVARALRTAAEGAPPALGAVRVDGALFSSGDTATKQAARPVGTVGVPSAVAATEQARPEHAARAAPAVGIGVALDGALQAQTQPAALPLRAVALSAALALAAHATAELAASARPTIHVDTAIPGAVHTAPQHAALGRTTLLICGARARRLGMRSGDGPTRRSRARTPLRSACCTRPSFGADGGGARRFERLGRVWLGTRSLGLARSACGYRPRSDVPGQRAQQARRREGSGDEPTSLLGRGLHETGRCSLARHEPEPCTLEPYTLTSPVERCSRTALLTAIGGAQGLRIARIRRSPSTTSG